MSKETVGNSTTIGHTHTDIGIAERPITLLLWMAKLEHIQVEREGCKERCKNTLSIRAKAAAMSTKTYR